MTVLHTTDHFESTILTTIKTPCWWHHPQTAETRRRSVLFTNWCTRELL